MIYGSGDYKYELVEGWAKLPQGYSFLDIGGLSIDPKGRVFILNRSPHPVIVLDQNGKFLSSWGEGIFKRPHGSRIRGNFIYCVDEGSHAVYKFTLDGKLIETIGNKDQPSDTGYVRKEKLMEALATIKRGGPPFNRPTGIDFNSRGEMYASDGYGNARVHKFSKDGKLLFSWGEPGTKAGQFMLPHNVWIDRLDRVWIPDRENSRIQIFNENGKLLTMWTDVFRPTDIYIDKDDIVYVSEIRPGVSIFNFEGKLLARWSNPEVDAMTDLFVSPHAISVDAKGYIYIGEVAKTHAGVDRGGRVIQKFARKR